MGVERVAERMDLEEEVVWVTGMEVDKEDLEGVK